MDAQVEADGRDLERYRAYLPVTDKTPVITLHEGNTDLVCARYLPKHLGVDVSIHAATLVACCLRRSSLSLTRTTPVSITPMAAARLAIATHRDAFCCTTIGSC